MATRVVLFGYGRPALAAIETFAALGVTPVAVVVPGNRTGADVDMVAAFAAERSLLLLEQPRRSAMAPFIEKIRSLGPDVLFVWSYSMLLPPELTALAPKGAFNIHAGILPDYRGGHVVNWMLINGETEGAATLHHIDAGIDTGDVVADERFPIDFADDIATVQIKLKAAGEALIAKWWPAIERGTAPRKPQDESRAHYYRMRTPDDGRIDWTKSHVEIYNLVRALVAPWPGAFTMVNGVRWVVRRCQPVDQPAVFPAGAVVEVEKTRIRVATGSGCLDLLSVEVEGAVIRDFGKTGLITGMRL